MAERDFLSEVLRGGPPSGTGALGLWVATAQERPLAAQLGVEVLRERVERWPAENVGLYVVASDYLVPYLRDRGWPCQPSDVVSLLAELTGSRERDDMLLALAALNQVGRRSDLVEEFRRRIAAEVDPALVEALEAALRSEPGQPQRVLLARPCILRAMRWVAEHAPSKQHATSAMQPASPVDAMLLVHLVAEGMGARSRTDGKTRVGGLSEGLALELVCNAFSSRRDNEGNMLGRTRLLYEDYGKKLRRAKPRVPPLTMVEEALGMPLDHALAVGFAYYAAAGGNDPMAAPPSFGVPLLGTQLPLGSWHQFLALFGQTGDELAARAAAAKEEWQMGSLQARPLLLVGQRVVVLDEDYLLERVTRGIYWLVHDHEKLKYGDGARRQWTQVHGEMHELLVESYLKALAPRSLGGARITFDEDDLGRAFPKAKRADFGVDFGATVLIADAQGGQVTTRTREQADAGAFVKDMDRLVVEKAEQLDITAKNLLRDPQPLLSPLNRPAPHVTPMVVTAGLFAQNPVVRDHVNGEITRRGLLQHPRIAPLAILDLRDLEHAAIVVAEHGVTLVDLLAEWRESGSADVSLSDWLAGGIYPTTPGVRMLELQAALECSFEAILTLVSGKEPAREGCGSGDAHHER